MSVVVTEKNQQKVVLNQARLNAAKEILGAKSESETLELALKKIIEEFELKNEAEKSQEIDSVFDLNYGKPKRIYEIEAEFEFVGRGQPMKYDLSDYNFDEYDTESGFFEDLFAEKTNLADGESIQAVIKEREEADF